MRVERCKGTRDLTPEEMSKFRLIEGIFRENCIKWGYEEVRTPSLEYLHLFTSTGTLTPSRLGRVYSFLDWDGWSGERVVLRPDGTIPIARAYIESMNDRELAKLFYVTNVFIFEETGAENREKWQCGVELIGPDSTAADVELILLALQILKKLGIENIELKLSHAAIIRALLAKSGLNPEEQTKVFDQVLDGDEEVLAKIKSEKPEVSKVLTSLINLNGKSSDFLKNLSILFKRDFPEVEYYLDNFISIVELLESVGVDFQIDIASGRGFEYYTGSMFQLFTGGESIGGGGRYDALIPLMGGPDIPASGFALYLDQLMSLIKPRETSGLRAQKVLIKAESGMHTLKEAFDLAGYFHQVGYLAEVHLGGKETDDFQWLLEIKKKTPRFKLTEQTNQRKQEARTREEILQLLK